MILEDFKAKLIEYEFIKNSEDNIQDVYKLIKANTYFHSKVYFHELTIEECLQDISALPPNTNMSQKFYYGIYKNHNLIAIIDYIEKYPNENTVFLGLFMLNQNYHRKGIAKHIIECFKEVVKENKFKYIELGCYEVNEIGYRFWNKMGFKIIDTKVNDKEGHALNLLKMRITL